MFFTYFIVADFKFPSVFPSQVHEDDLWNHFEHMVNVEVDNAVYNYSKQRAVDTMVYVLEMRLNSQWYMIFSTFKHVFLKRLNFCSGCLLVSLVGWRSSSIPICWQSITSHMLAFRQWISQHILVILPIFAMVFLSLRQTLMHIFLLSMSKHVNTLKI